MLLWRNQSEVEILNFLKNHISAWVNNASVLVQWLFTGFYGEPKTSLRMRTWNLLRNIKPNDPVPWMMIEDFNKILYHSKKVGAEIEMSFS